MLFKFDVSSSLFFHSFRLIWFFGMWLDLRAFINKHLKFHKSVDYGDGGIELLELIDCVRTNLCQPDVCEALIDVPIPVTIIGDMHGQFFDLQRIFLSLGLPGPQRYLFLGGKPFLEIVSNFNNTVFRLCRQRIILRGMHCFVVGSKSLCTEQSKYFGWFSLIVLYLDLSPPWKSRKSLWVILVATC